MTLASALMVLARRCSSTAPRMRRNFGPTCFTVRRIGPVGLDAGRPVLDASGGVDEVGHLIPYAGELLYDRPRLAQLAGHVAQGVIPGRQEGAIGIGGAGVVYFISRECSLSDGDSGRWRRPDVRVQRNGPVRRGFQRGCRPDVGALAKTGDGGFDMRVFPN